MTEQEFQKALPLAIGMFKQFYDEMMTGLNNSMANCERAKYNNPNGANSISYFMGKSDAFREIVERIEKERDLVVNEAISKEGMQEYDERETHFRIARDRDIEMVFPHEEWMPRLMDQQLFNHHRGELARMLEHYFRTGFMLGCGKMHEDEIKEFNPEGFENTLIRALLPRGFNPNAGPNNL